MATTAAKGSKPLADSSQQQNMENGSPNKRPRSPTKPGKLLVKLLTDTAVMPKRGSTGSAGYDLAR